MPPPQSDLPIIQVDEPNASPPPSSRPRRARYGALFYLALGGLGFLIVMIGWFAYNAWALRTVWGSILVVWDTGKPTDERVQAAWTLAHDPQTPQQVLWDNALAKSLPELARYVLAEGLTGEILASDPKDYTERVALSKNWPDWLRLLALRPLAYVAEEGIEFPEAPLAELSKHPDPMIRLWTAYIKAATIHSQPAEQDLKTVAAAPGPYQKLAQLLLTALHARDADRKKALDEATVWIRTHHPQAAELWKGWEEKNGKLVHQPTK